LKSILEEAGVSKQAFAQHKIQEQDADLHRNWVINQILEKRRQHPVMGLKKIFKSLEVPLVGRDKFIEIGMNANLNISLPKNYTRTTFSTKSKRYQNLLVDKAFDDINQIWVTDITYFRIGENFTYICLIMDVYSRRIIGYQAATSLHAQLCMDTLNRALKTRKTEDYKEQLIHHSDKGTQYIFNDYTNLLDKKNIQISMCNSAYENAHMERLNGIIKNEYLVHYNIKSFEQLIYMLPKAVKAYNEDRIHWELDNFLCPIQFEKSLNELPKCQRTILNIFVEEKTKAFQELWKNQLVLF
jgi:putative transposase